MALIVMTTFFWIVTSAINLYTLRKIHHRVLRAARFWSTSVGALRHSAPGELREMLRRQALDDSADLEAAKRKLAGHAVFTFFCAVGLGMGVAMLAAQQIGD